MGHTRINNQPEMTRYLVEELSVFKNDPVVICDVGARGGFEPQWQVFGSQAIFIGFEPDAEESAYLQNSATSANYQIYPLALGKQREQRLFSVCRYPAGSSFYPADLEFIRRFPPEYTEDLTVVQTLEMETISLDEFVRDYKIANIDFIKLDVEGSELDILQGAQSKAVKFKKFLGMESDSYSQISQHHGNFYIARLCFRTDSGKQ
jgi:FkbM family methyltransferase